MTRPARSPLDATDRVVVDGTNLLHRLGGPATPPAAIVARLRAAIPMPIPVELVFDGVGHGVTGRVAQAMRVRHSGRRTADETILEMVGDGAASPVASAGTLVVTDDRALRLSLAARGARTAGVAWLLARMDVPARPAPGSRGAGIGAGRPPHPAAPAPGRDPDGGREDRPAWRPGRGATAKTGTARRVARHRRHPRHP